MSRLANYSSAVKAKKLIISNRTQWDTRLLRTVFLKVINENIKYEGPLKHVIRCTIVHGRSRSYSGYAWLNSGRMRLRLPRPTDRCWHCNNGKVDLGWPRDDGKEGRIWVSGKPNPAPCKKCDGTGKSKSNEGLVLDTFKLAHLFEHELAHCRGYQHKGMCSLNSWNHATAKSYPYLAAIAVTAKMPLSKPKPTVDDRRQRQLARTLASIRRWQTKAKRAATALRKLTAQHKRIEKLLGGGPAES